MAPVALQPRAELRPLPRAHLPAAPRPLDAAPSGAGRRLGGGSWGRGPGAPPLPYLRAGGGGGAGRRGAGPGPGGGARAQEGAERRGAPDLRGSLGAPLPGGSGGVPTWAEPCFPPEVVPSGRRPLLPGQSA